MKISEVVDEEAAAAVAASDLGNLGATAVSPETTQKITKVQSFLLKLGYPIGTADGLWGPRSTMALKMLQKKVNTYAPSVTQTSVQFPASGVWSDITTGFEQVVTALATAKKPLGPTAAEKQAILDYGKKPQLTVVPTPGPAGSTTPEQPGTAITPSEQVIEGQTLPSVTTEPGFMDKLREWMKSPWYWVGIAGLGVGIYMLWRMSKTSGGARQVAAVETLALDDGLAGVSKPKRKRRKKKAKKVEKEEAAEADEKDEE